MANGPTPSRGSQADWCGHRNYRVRLADRHASVPPLGGGIFEVRTDLEHNRMARVLFYIDRMGRMVLLHGFIKKTRKMPNVDLHLARGRKRQHERGSQ